MRLLTSHSSGSPAWSGQRTPQPNLPLRTINEEESDFAFGFPGGHDGQFLQHREGGLRSRISKVTFDDGWASQHANALPILEKYGIQASWYIVSGYVDNVPDYMTRPPDKAVGRKRR